MRHETIVQISNHPVENRGNRIISNLLSADYS